MNPRKRWPKGTWMKVNSPDALAELMKEKRIGYDRMARYAGVSKGFISHLAKGRRTTCTPLVGARIAESLGVPYSLLFTVTSSTERRVIDDYMSRGAAA